MYGLNSRIDGRALQLIGASHVIREAIGGVMRRVVGCIVAAAAIAGAASAIAQNTRDQFVIRPWQVGVCYRVFRIVNEPPELFKVLTPPEGSWVRVEADPKAPWVPGARPAAPVWLNINSVFVLQEWPCSQFP
jgi:hypothetical protein